MVRKEIYLDEKVIESLQYLALKAKSRSVKNYMETVLIDHAKKKSNGK